MEMIRMFDLRHEKGTIQMINRSTAVECARDVKCWRSFRALIAVVIPCCGCQSFSTAVDDTESILGSTVTGTIYGYRKGRVSFCVQEDSRSTPLLLLDLAIPTYLLVKEMHSGLLRIALKCEYGKEGKKSLFSEPLWSMYCNGRNVGFAIKRQPSDTDRSILNLVQSISTGAGVIPMDDKKADEDQLIYMRASYERVVGSPDCEAFHMINPDGAAGHELSIFLLRS